MVKAAIIVGCALLLATGTAHAGRYNNWKCGDNITLATAIEKVNPPSPLPVVYGFYIDGLRIPKARVTIDRDGQPRLNGKRCTWTEKNPDGPGGIAQSHRAAGRSVSGLPPNAPTIRRLQQPAGKPPGDNSSAPEHCAA